MAIYTIGRTSAASTGARYIDGTGKTRWNQVDRVTTLPHSKKIQYRIYGHNDGGTGGQNSKVVPVGIRRRDTGEILHQATITIADNAGSFKDSAIFDVDLPAGVEIEIGFASQEFGSIAIWAGSSDAVGSFQTSNGVRVIENPSILDGGAVNFRYVLYANIETIVPPTSVDQFNSTNSIIRGQTEVDYSTTGFPAVNEITSNAPGVTVNSIVDASGDGKANISNYIEGGVYPRLPATVIFTFKNGSLSNTISKIISIKPTEVSNLFSGAIAADPTFLPYWLAMNGRSIVDGSQVVYEPGPKNVFIDSDGTLSADPGATTFPLWYRDGTDGKMYEYLVSINADGEVIDVVSRTISGAHLRGSFLKGNFLKGEYL